MNANLNLALWNARDLSPTAWRGLVFGQENQVYLQEPEGNRKTGEGMGSWIK